VIDARSDLPRGTKSAASITSTLKFASVLRSE
jgi:hypothetical protein